MSLLTFIILCNDFLYHCVYIPKLHRRLHSQTLYNSCILYGLGTNLCFRVIYSKMHNGIQSSGLHSVTCWSGWFVERLAFGHSETVYDYQIACMIMNMEQQSLKCWCYALYKLFHWIQCSNSVVSNLHYCQSLTQL